MKNGIAATITLTGISRPPWTNGDFLWFSSTTFTAVTAPWLIMNHVNLEISHGKWLTTSSRPTWICLSTAIAYLLWVIFFLPHRKQFIQDWVPRWNPLDPHKNSTFNSAIFVWMLMSCAKYCQAHRTTWPCMFSIFVIQSIKMSLFQCGFLFFFIGLYDGTTVYHLRTPLLNSVVTIFCKN